MKEFIIAIIIVSIPMIICLFMGLGSNKGREFSDNQSKMADLDY